MPFRQGYAIGFKRKSDAEKRIGLFVCRIAAEWGGVARVY